MKRLPCTVEFLVFIFCTVLCAFETEAAPLYQKFKTTAHMGDSKTNRLSTLPRCGIKDTTDVRIPGGRSRRYILQGFKWENRTSLTYKVGKYATSLDSKTVDEEIARAFAIWSEHADLTFSPKSGEVDLEIRFEVKEHGDETPFDGLGSHLAHAFFPKFGGDIHFDDDENWTANSTSGSNLFEIAVHEIGHALGLKHNDIPASVMNPYETPWNPNFKLDSDDVAGIQAMYGPKKMNRLPEICEDPSVETMITSVEGWIFAFKGNYYWRITEGRFEDPKPIVARWKGLPENMDFAFTDDNGHTHFVKESEYWSYVGDRMEEGCPRKVLGTQADIVLLKKSIEANKRISAISIEILCNLKSMITVKSDENEMD